MVNQGPVPPDPNLDYVDTYFEGGCKECEEILPCPITPTPTVTNTLTLTPTISLPPVEGVRITIRAVDCCTETLRIYISIPLEGSEDVVANGRVYIVDGCSYKAVAITLTYPFDIIRDNWNYASL